MFRKKTIDSGLKKRCLFLLEFLIFSVFSAAGLSRSDTKIAVPVLDRGKGSFSETSGTNARFYSELLDYMATENLWDYDFIELLDDTSSMAMLENGSLDFIFGTYKTEERVKNGFLFSDYPCGTESLVIVARQDDNRFNISSFPNSSGITIGFDSTNPYSRDCIRAFEMENSVILHKYYFDNSRDAVDQVRSGNLDLCLVALSAPSDDLKIIYKCRTIPVFFTARNPVVMEKINDAIQSLLKHSPFSLVEMFLRSSAFPVANVRNLSWEEKQYIASNPHVELINSCSPHENELKQVNQLFWNRMEGISGIKILSDEENSGALQDSSVKIYETYFYSSSEVNSKKVSHPLYDMNVRFICNQENSISDFSGYSNKFFMRPARIAITSDIEKVIPYFVERMSFVREDSIICYDTPLECLEAVNSGRCDALLINNFYLMKKYTLSDFKNLRNAENLLFSIPISAVVDCENEDEAELFVSILNETLGRMPYKYYSTLVESVALSVEYVAPKRIRFYKILTIVVLVLIIIITYTFAGLVLNNQEYKRQSRTDESSGLLNLRGFEEAVLDRLEHSGGRKYAVTEFKIRRFSTLNKIYGTEAGDNLIQTISSVLSAKYNEEAVLPLDQRRKISFRVKGILKKDLLKENVARIYTDAFCIVQPVVVDENQYIKSLSWFQETLQEALCRQMQFNVVIKSGTVFSDPSIRPSLDEVKNLMSNADYARIQKHKSMLDNISVFDENMRAIREEEDNIDVAIEQALQNEEFFVVFQPKMDVASQKLMGAEALVRWNRDSEIARNPERFISILEKNGYIDRLDFYVYRKTFEYMQELLDSGIPLVPISLNVSRQCYDARDFVERFYSLFQRYSIPEKFIELEIEERFVAAGNASVAEMVKLLHEKGFKVSMDDFGTGASSLNMLSEIPLDAIKFDRGFLTKAETSLQSRIVLGSLMNMIKKMGMQIICEGVETKAQLEILREMECDLVQGFYYSRPVEGNEFTSFILKHG